MSMGETLTIVGADERAREEVRRRAPAWAVGTIAIVRDRADWRLIERLEGPVALLVLDRGCADEGLGGWPTFHIDEVAAAAEALASFAMRPDWAMPTFEEEAW
ncbi:MAG TPA: hypothetical protein VEZ72_14845 [Paenibacillus sp.]|nr:hypothetical protein [Paenibacillus sp.]